MRWRTLITGSIHNIRGLKQVLLRWDWFFTVLGVLTTVLIAHWFITAGRISVWRLTTHYFDRLGSAFLDGRLSLPDQPSPELLAMKNPYDWQAREQANVPVVWDASLYDGKYYLYWGPVPALVAAGLKATVGGLIDDSVLVFIFYTGLIIFLGLILQHLRERLFSNQPAWLLAPLILFGGLTSPMLWLVNRPSVYEAAITGGQFFLAAGLFCALRAMPSRARSGAWLLGAGVCWGLAVGCRLNLVLVTGFLALVLAVFWLRSRITGKNGRLRAALLLLLLVLPLLLAAMGLGWYNDARFGNVLETGHRYQLTGEALPADYGDVTSIRYIIPSVYAYLFRMPLIYPQEFPFVFVPNIDVSMWPSFIRLPAHYAYGEPIAGLLTLTPAVWLLLIPAITFLRRRPRGHADHEPKMVDSNEKSFIWVMLAGGCVLLFLPLLVFISTSLRYLADVLPFLTLLAAMSLWHGLESMLDNPGLRKLLVTVGVALLGASVLMGIFSAFTIGTPFKARNLDLFLSIKAWFIWPNF